MVETLIKDVRYALRWMARSPGFSAVAILSLGLGVGVNTAMFSLVDSLLFRPLPVTSPDTLVDIFTTGGDGDEYATSSYQDFLDLKSQNTVFSDMLGYSPMMAPLNLGDRSRIALGQVVTSNHFTMLGVQPALGRLLVAADDDPGAERVVVIAHRMWQREFGSDRAIVGKPLTLRGLPYTIAGVAPASFTGVVPLLTPELWLPIQYVEEVEPAGINDSVPSPIGKTRLERRGFRWMFVKGRLQPGVSAEQAHANVALLGRQLEAANLQTNRNRRIAAVPTKDVRLLVPQAGGILSVGAAGLMTVVGLVLLIACANVAGMLLARASARRREISVRLAIGASRGRLIQQLLVEGALLGALGALAAIALAAGLIQVVQGMRLPLPVDIAFDLRIDYRVLTFSVLLAAVTGLFAGLLPAIKASAPSLVSDLRGEAPAGRIGRRRFALRDALVVSQVAFTAVLLVVAGLLLRSLGASESADVGFDMRGVAAISLDTDMVRFSPERSEVFWREALTRVRALPGVQSAGFVSPSLPFGLNFSQSEMRVDSRTYSEGQRGEIIENTMISPTYLETLGVPIIEGRGIAETDVAGSPAVVVINQTMARTFWPNESAVGHTLQVLNGSQSRTYRIVGVNRDHKQHGVLERPYPFAYFADSQRPNPTYKIIVARTGGGAEALLAAMRRELLAMESGLVFMGNSTMEQTMGLSLMPARVGAMLAAGFGGLGTLLAAIGLYGVIAFSVARRTREIGVRMALGANPGGVLSMVMRQGFTIVAVGLVAGAVLAGAAATALRGLLYGISPFDPIAWGFAIAAMSIAAALANFVPARRAMRIDPMTALRIE
ncbi:MAG TPA: ABC transporter permease [Vicinamibacterales bacterium]|nr:ABC transporter permease [Vicinamibacterales bacterium]